MGITAALFVRTNYDVAVRVLHDQVTQDIIEYAKSRLFSHSDLSGNTANRSNFELEVWRYNPEVVVISTHGSYEGLMGQDQTTEILSPANSIWMKGRIGYFIACRAGRDLADICVSNGARAVLGFDEDLTIAVYTDGENAVLVEGFKEFLCKPAVLFDGVKVKDAYNSTKQEMEKWIDFWDERDPMVADIIRWDRDHFVLKGSGEESVRFSWYLFMGVGDILMYIAAVEYFFLTLIRSYKRWTRK